MRLSSIFFGAALCALAGSALADPTPGELQAARELFGKAVADEDAGHWKDALDKMKRAGSVKMTPGIRFHIALAEEKTGQLVAALADYTAAEQAARAENNREVLDLVSEPLKALRAKVPTLTINVPDVPGVEVALDGKVLPIGLFGIAMPVEPNQPHDVVAKATGKQVFSTQASLKERETKSIDVKFVDAPKPPDGDHGTTTTPPPPDGTHHVTTPPERPPVAESPSKSLVAPIVVTTLAVGTLAFGFASFFVAGGKQDDLKAQCPTLLPAQCDDLRGPVRTWDALSLGGFIAAGALAVVSVVLWAQPGPAPSATPTTARLSVGPSGVAIVGSFR